MSYFEMFPSLFYDAKGNKTYTQQKNLLARLKLVNVDKQNILNFDSESLKTNLQENIFKKTRHN